MDMDNNVVMAKGREGGSKWREAKGRWGTPTIVSALQNFNNNNKRK